MERPEVVEKSARSEENETAARLLESVRFEAAAGRPQVNIEKESEAIANTFDFNNKVDPESYSDKIEKGTERLSKDLQKLSGDMPKYNQLMQEVNNKIPDEPAMNPYIQLNDYNRKTGTWNNVAVTGGDGFSAFRIVQPGNTFNQIVRDSYNDFVKLAGEGGFQSYDEFRKSVVDLNKIDDPSKLKVGQAIKLRDSYFWS